MVINDGHCQHLFSVFCVPASCQVFQTHHLLGALWELCRVGTVNGPILRMRITGSGQCSHLPVVTQQGVWGAGSSVIPSSPVPTSEHPSRSPGSFVKVLIPGPTPNLLSRNLYFNRALPLSVTAVLCCTVSPPSGPWGDCSQRPRDQISHTYYVGFFRSLHICS